MIEFDIINNQESFERYCQQWSKEDFLCIDTEFVRTTTFYPNLGLIQIGWQGKNALIDPLVIDDLSSFGKLLADENICKVVHSGSEDMDIFYHQFGNVPNNIFDTQIAAAFLGKGISIGYASIIKELLDIEVNKEQTQSDWCKRPLSDEQLQYAAADVLHLQKIYPLLKEELAERSAWVREESYSMACNVIPVDDKQYYLKIRQAWSLKGARLYCLQQLCIWREQLARKQNVPRSRVVADKMLFEIARILPSYNSQLAKVKDMHSRIIRKHGPDIIALVEECRNAEQADWPQLIERPLIPQMGDHLKQLKQLVEQCAIENGIPAECLAKRKPLEQWLRSGQFSGKFTTPHYFKGWRSLIITPILQTYLEKMNYGS